MKKLVALMLAFVMMAAAAVPAFADVTPAEHYKPNPEKKLTVDGETGLVEVTYEVSAKWQILIPADVVFVETYGLKFLADVEAQSARIPIGQTLTLTVESANNYKMVNTTSESDNVPYAVSFVKNNTMPNSEPPKPMVADWPELDDSIYGDRAGRAEAYQKHFSVDPYRTAGTEGETQTELLSVEGKGTTIPKVTTTLAFYTAGTDTIGTYKDTLTFTARLITDEPVTE